MKPVFTDFESVLSYHEVEVTPLRDCVWELWGGRFLLTFYWGVTALIDLRRTCATRVQGPEHLDALIIDIKRQ